MHPDQAALQAIGSGLEELEKRVTALADGHKGGPRGELSDDLYELERSLRSARRLLDRLQRRR